MAALTYADVIVCQTENQQTLLKQNFGRDSYFLPNPFDTDGWMAALQASPDLPLNIPARFAFWIGRSDLHHKRPDLLLQVASLCPEVQFLMVMNTFDFKVASQIRAQRPSNVVLIDRIPFHKMPACFRRAAMFVSTSNPDFEGFPNVFLQAAASTVPVVSLSTDPGFVTDHNAGVVCEGDIHRLAAQVKLLWSDPERGKRLGENGRNYVRHYHSASDSRNRLEEIFNAVFR